MSLDVYLKMPTAVSSENARIFIRENGSNREISREEWDRRFPEREPITLMGGETDRVFEQNITHNLNKMADAAGIYEHLWRPDEIGIATAKELIEPLSVGLARLRSEPGKYMEFNPSNGWGSYHGLIEFVEEYLAACKKYPEANVSVSR